MLFRFIIALLPILFLSTASAQDKETLCIKKASSIEQKLGCLEGVTVASSSGQEKSRQVFEIKIEQNIDHENPQRGKFAQRLVLIHRSEAEPMVLQTSGYSIFGVADSNISRTFQTNQIQVEHRYFRDSTPADLDWKLLNIQQSAADFHQVTIKFKKIYKGPWVNTGASKGGMTSVYHRFFYPEDLDGTVADVAPLSFSRRDQRYNLFLSSVGGDQYAKCRQDWKNFQVQLLQRRSELVPLFKGSFEHLGSADLAFEHAVIEAPFYFWQYSSPDNPFTGCRSIPNANADAQTMIHFLTSHASPHYFGDSMLAEFQPYYYQAATELGGPDGFTAHLDALRRYDFDVSMYAPKGAALVYSNASMRLVDTWVKTEAEEILFIYGSFDPWTAGEFDIGGNSKVHKLYVDGGNHSASFQSLTGASNKKAFALLTGWLKKQPIALNETLGLFPVEPTLEQIEAREKKRLGLP